MTSLPDKPFRDSLEHYKKSPPPQAWNRIESGLHTTKTRNIWITSAAAVLLMISASFLLWHSRENQTPTPFIAVDQNCETEIIQQKPVTQFTNESISSPKIETAPVSTSPPPKQNPNQRITLHVQEDDNSIASVSNETPPGVSIPPTETASIISEPTRSPTGTDNVASASPRSNKIVYSSGEVNSRFLKKESASSTIVPPPEKPQTGIKKIIEIASNLKYEENALGELREMKNEILSLPRKEATADKNK